MSGTLFLCATPIGNLEDMTYRAVRILQEADLIAAEDTRNSIKLLNHFDIHTPMVSYHEHNKWEKGREIVEKLLGGTNVALITDAGMPGISDPGEVLCRLAHDAGICVTVIPGACAAVSALAVSGQPTDRFVFEGFLPKSGKERKEKLEYLAAEERTVVIYEAPHRIRKTMAELKEYVGEERELSICRELTKTHEEIRRTNFGEAAAYYEETEPRGEFVLVIKGRPAGEAEREQQEQWKALSVEEHVALYTDRGIDRKEAMKLAAKDRGVSKRDIYNALNR